MLSEGERAELHTAFSDITKRNQELTRMVEHVQPRFSGTVSELFTPSATVAERVTTWRPR